MPLYVCDECGCVDNTALTNYWTRGIDWETRTRAEVPALCSSCDPEIGHWHDNFPRRLWDGREDVVNRPKKEKTA